MAENSKIEWTTHTFNPWRGCTKVSAGCANCYAETLSGRNPGTLGVWGPNGTRVVASESMWKEPLKWNRQAQQNLDEWKEHSHAGSPPPARPRVFCASLGDVFEDWTGPMVDSRGRETECIQGETREWAKHGTGPLTMQDVRARLFALIDATPNLDWLLLTKRPENIARMMPARFAWVETGVKIWQLESPVGSRRFHGIVWGETSRPTFSMPGGSTSVHSDGRIEERGAGERPTVEDCKSEIERRFPVVRPNVWIGTSVENQQAADERIPHLLRVPAKVRFLSCEPLLGPVDLHDRPEWFWKSAGIHWVIVGGESGPGARPMHPDWARSLRDQCQAAGVPFFFKQWGEWWPYFAWDDDMAATYEDAVGNISTSDHGEFPPGFDCGDPKHEEHCWPKKYPDSDDMQSSFRVGKKAAGRLLDGRTWDEFPAVNQ